MLSSSSWRWWPLRPEGHRATALAAFLVLVLTGCDESVLEETVPLDIRRDSDALADDAVVEKTLNDARGDVADAATDVSPCSGADAVGGFVEMDTERSDPVYALVATSTQGCIEYRVEWRVQVVSSCPTLIGGADGDTFIEDGYYAVDVCNRCDEPVQAHWWLPFGQYTEFEGEPDVDEPIPLDAVRYADGFFTGVAYLRQVAIVLEQDGIDVPIGCRTNCDDWASTVGDPYRLYTLLQPSETLQLPMTGVISSVGCEGPGRYCSWQNCGPPIDPTEPVTVRLPVPRLWPASKEWREFPADRQASIACELAGYELEPGHNLLDLAPWSEDEPLYIEVEDLMLPPAIQNACNWPLEEPE